jgi:glucose/mannose transport system substrate-binding protein
MPAEIAQHLKVEGHHRSIPISLQFLNWMYYSRKVLKDAGIETMPENWDDMFAVYDKIKAKDYIPLALGAGVAASVAVRYGSRFDGSWQDLQKNLRRQGRRGNPVHRVPQGRRAFLKLRNYVDPASIGRNWNDSTALVITDKATMQFIGGYGPVSSSRPESRAIRATVAAWASATPPL